LPSQVQAAVEQIQPFQRTGAAGTPQQDGLLLLQRLSNVDKHEVALRPLLNPLELAHSFAVEFQSEEDAAAEGPPKVEIGASFEDSAILLHQVTRHPIAKVTGSYDFNAQAVVNDPVVGPIGITAGLAQLLTYVDQVCGFVLASARNGTAA
jgi:hypothetical protein